MHPRRPSYAQRASPRASGDITPIPPRLPRVLDRLEAQDLPLEDDARLNAVQIGDLDLGRTSAESVEFRQCRLDGVELSGAEFRQAVFEDCSIAASSLANLNVDRSLLHRVDMSSLRMIGFHFVGGVAQDLQVRDCRLTHSSFRFTKLRKTVFAECNLVGADFQGADLAGAQFIGCDLEGAQFSQAKMCGARFVDCILSGIGGVSSFRGATVRSEDLISLVRVLATELGIMIERSVSDHADP